MWPSDYRADDTNATALLNTNLWALQTTRVQTLVSTTNFIPSFTLGGETVGPFTNSPYSWTNVYYTRIGDGSAAYYPGATNISTASYTNGTVLITNTTSAITVGGEFSFRANHIDMRTLDIKNNFDRRYEIYCPTQTAYMAANFPNNLDTNFFLDPLLLSTNLQLYKSERTNLVWIKQQLFETFSNYCDMGQADTGGLYGAYLESSNRWQYGNVQSCVGGTQDAYVAQWILTRPLDLPRISIESLARTNSLFPHTITTNILTNAPGYYYGIYTQETIAGATYTTLTYSSGWFDFTPYRAIGGILSNAMLPRVMTNSWTFDPWAIASTNGVTNALYTANGYNDDYTAQYVGNYDTNGVKTSACVTVFYEVTNAIFTGCVYSATNFSSLSVIITNDFIDDGYDWEDYGWRWIPFVFSNMQHLILNSHQTITNWIEVQANFNNCGVTNTCQADWSTNTTDTTDYGDYYYEFIGSADPSPVIYTAYGLVIDDGNGDDGFLYEKKAQAITIALPVSKLDNISSDIYLFTEIFDFNIELVAGGATWCAQIGDYPYPFSVSDAYATVLKSAGKYSTVDNRFGGYLESFPIDAGEFDWLALPDYTVLINTWDYDYDSVPWLDDPSGTYDRLKGWGIYNLIWDDGSGTDFSIKTVIRFD